MKKNIKAYSGFFTVLMSFYVFCFSTHGQVEGFQQISVADGLSQGMVFDITQDQDGFIWVATKNGLNRYDGNNFKVFYPNRSNRYALPEGEIITLYQDSRGWIWLGTTNAGLHFYVPELQRFYQAISHEALISQLKTYQITSVKEGPAGELWVGCSNGQIIKLTYKETRSGITPTQPADLSSYFELEPIITTSVRMNRIFNFHFEPNGEILAVGRLSLTVIRNQVQQIPFEKPLPWGRFRYRYSSIQEQNGSRYLLTNNALYQLTKDYRLVLQKKLDEANGSIIKFDQLGNVWAARKNQLYSTSLDDIENICDAENLRVIINPKAKLTCLLNDRKGNTWIGSSGFGIYKINKTSTIAHNYFNNISSWQLYQDSHGRLYSWEYNELYVNDKGNEKRLWEKYSVGTLLESKDGTYWRLDRPDRIVQSDFYLSHLDASFNLLGTYNSQRKIDVPYLRMIEDTNGDLIIAGVESELLKFNPKSKTFSYHSFEEKLPSGVTETAYLYEDINHNLWLCSKSGLLRATPKGDRYAFKAYTSEEGKSNGLPSNATTSAVDWPRDAKRFLLVGTQANGLAILDKTNDSFELITREQGLPDNGIMGIIPFGKDSVWISTFRGLAAYNFETQTSQVFGSIDGLQADEFNTGSSMKGNDGEVIFGGIKGVSVVKPDDLRALNKPKDIRLVNLRINGQLIKPQDETGILPIAIEKLPTLALSHEQNNISIDFSEFSFLNAKYSSLKYRLKGVNDNWIDAGANQTASFVLLPPGDYTFEIKSSFAAENEEIPVQFMFNIAPPWYASWWAILAYALAIVLAVYLVSNYRRRQYNLQQELAFNEKEKERLADLDKMKSAFLTNVSHELKTPLTLISGPAEMLQKKYPKERLLGLMNNNVSRLQDLVLQLLDIQKTQAGKQQLSISEFDVASHIRMIAYSFESWMASKEITFTYAQNHTAVNGFTDKDKLSKIITNLISNAVKFTPAGGEIGIDSHFSEEKQSLVFSVKDSGVGIAEENVGLIFDRFYQVEGDDKQGTGIGLALVKELVNLLKGSITVNSSEGSGSIFEVELPLGKENWKGNELVVVAPESEYEKIEDEEESSEKPVLLLVEDNPDMQDYLEVLLHSDYQVISANNGVEGLKIARQTIPDIILTDLMMPKMDGLEFSAQVKTKVESSHIPIIMLTAKDTKDTKLKGFETGLDYFLNKPFDSDELRGVLQTVLQNRQNLQNLYRDKLVTENEVSNIVKDSFLNSFKAYLVLHFNNPELNTVSMAADFNLSSKQFSRKIKALSGSSPKELLRKYRLQKAAKLLKETEDTASEIAYAVGYETLAYFSKSFSDEFGVSPSKYASE